MKTLLIKLIVIFLCVICSFPLVVYDYQKIDNTPLYISIDGWDCAVVLNVTSNNMIILSVYKEHYQYDEEYPPGTPPIMKKSKVIQQKERKEKKKLLKSIRVNSQYSFSTICDGTIICMNIGDKKYWSEADFYDTDSLQNQSLQNIELYKSYKRNDVQKLTHKLIGLFSTTLTEIQVQAREH